MNLPQNTKSGNPTAPLMNSNNIQSIKYSQDINDSGTCPLTLLVVSKIMRIFAAQIIFKTMALEIKVIPTLTGEDAVRFVNKAEGVSKSRERIDFSAQIADAREILKNARI